MTFALPPLVKSAERLLLETEKAVRLFPKYHKYAHGAVLRAQAMAVAKAAHKAWRDRQHQVLMLERLSEAIDDFKLSIEVVASISVDVGKQCGGLLKQQHQKRQSAMQRQESQRPQILSSRGASAFEAHP